MKPFFRYGLVRVWKAVLFAPSPVCGRASGIKLGICIAEDHPYIKVRMLFLAEQHFLPRRYVKQSFGFDDDVFVFTRDYKIRRIAAVSSWPYKAQSKCFKVDWKLGSLNLCCQLFFKSRTIAPCNWAGHRLEVVSGCFIFSSWHVVVVGNKATTYDCIEACATR
jgi:hypothetical protein